MNVITAIYQCAEADPENDYGYLPGSSPRPVEGAASTEPATAAR